MAKSSKKPKANKVGRPPTDVVWKGIGVRFKANEKAELAIISDSVDLTQAEFIRQGTLKLMDQVKQTGKIEIQASK